VCNVTVLTRYYSYAARHFWHRCRLSFGRLCVCNGCRPIVASVWIAGELGGGFNPNCFLNPPNRLSN